MAKILVIDDDAEFLEMLRVLLEKRAGHQAMLSADGQEGLEKAIESPPDLAILDVMMPGVTGYEICRALRANPATEEIPIIILTARGQPVDRQAALDAGADDFMSKPVTMDELMEKINKLLARQQIAKLVPFTGTVTLLSLRGGVGVTTLAVNLATTLAQAKGGHACLIDHSVSSGQVALQLGLRPKPNLNDLIQAGTIDAEKVQSTLIQHDSGLHILASSIVPLAGQEIPPDLTRNLLAILDQQFVVTIIDAPSTLNRATMVALEATDLIGLVIAPEAGSIQTAIGTLGALKPWSKKVRVILNQTMPGASPPTEAIERAIKRRLMTAIPYDPAQSKAISQRAPLSTTKPDSPLAQAVRELAQTLE